MEKRQARHHHLIISLILILMSVPTILLAAPVDNRDIRARGMGSVGVSMSGSHAAIFANPAALFFRGQEHDTSFYVAAAYGDDIVPWDISKGLPCAFLQQPLLSLDLSFSGRNLALTIRIDNQLKAEAARVQGTPTVPYSAYYNSLIQLDVAFGYKTFGIGAFLRGGNQSIRENITISNSNTFLDYVTQTLLERYSPVEDSESFSVGLGMQLNYSWISMGVCTETLLTSQGATSAVFSGSSILDTLTCGISFKTPTYTRDNQLSLFVFEGACDFYHLGDNETRAVHIGIEAMFQLLPNWSISLRTGFIETKPELNKMFAFSVDNACQTFGLGATMDKFNLDFVCEVPIRWYLGKNLPTDSIACSVALSFTV